jgi:hypothetical protein
VEIMPRQSVSGPRKSLAAGWCKAFRGNCLIWRGVWYRIPGPRPGGYKRMPAELLARSDPEQIYGAAVSSLACLASAALNADACSGERSTSRSAACTISTIN